MLCIVAALLLVPLVAGNDQAKSLRRQADDLILTRKWSEAIQLLSASITLEPSNYLGYLKRSQAYQGAGMHALALGDVDEVLKRKPDHAKSAAKRVELLLQLGRYSDALEASQRLLQSNPSDADAIKARDKATTLATLRAQTDELKRIKNSGGALRTLDALLQAGANRDLIAEERCQVLFDAGQYYDVVAEAMAILKRDSLNIKALLVRARSFFLLGEVDAALNHLKQCLKAEPEHAECASESQRIRVFHDHRDTVQKLIAAQQWTPAAAAIRVALADVPDVAVYQAELTVSLCDTLAKGGATIEDWKEGVTVCGRAAELSAAPEAMKELRGNLHLKLGMYAEAIQDFSSVLQTQPNNHRMRQRIQEVQNAKKLAERKDYYKILDVPRDCSKQQAKSAFRKLALVWHPDKFSTTEEREKANKMFQDINEAYDVLTDEDKRARFDRGEDVDAQPQHQGFNPFGGGGGGGQFHFRFQ